MMLASDLKKFGKLLIPIALLAWGLFYLATSASMLELPSWFLWLGVVFGTAVMLTVGMAAYFRHRERSKQRW